MFRLFFLIGGNLFAQIVQIAAIPFLTRAYGPESYGLYGFFSSCLLFTGMLATLRYELAIQLPKSLNMSCAVAGLSAAVSLFFSFFVLVSFGACFYFFEIVPNPFFMAAVLSVSTLLLAMFNILNSLALRLSLYRMAAMSRVAQVVASVSSAFLLWFFGFKDSGLLVANVLLFTRKNQFMIFRHIRKLSRKIL